MEPTEQPTSYLHIALPFETARWLKTIAAYHSVSPGRVIERALAREREALGLEFTPSGDIVGVVEVINGVAVVNGEPTKRRAGRPTKAAR